jgi:hypothetical protein
MPRTLIAFTGKMGAGKSTAAKALTNRGYTRIRFAGPLKSMMAQLGLNEREIDGDLKELPCALLGGKTPRFAMQTIGTEWGRDTISSSLWVDVFKHTVNKLPDYIPVVVDDCRFPNEAQAIRDLGGHIVKVTRPNLTIASLHSSEMAELPFYAVLENNTDDIYVLAGLIEQLRRNQSWARSA